MSSMTLDLLHSAYAGPFAAKRLAQDAKVSFRTAEKWWARLTTPRADVLLRLARENKALRAMMVQALQGEAYAEAQADVGAVRSTARGVVAPTGGVDRGEPAHAVASPRAARP